MSIKQLVKAIHKGVKAVKEAKEKLRTILRAAKKKGKKSLDKALDEAAHAVAEIYGVKAEINKNGNWSFKDEQGKVDDGARLFYSYNIICLATDGKKGKKKEGKKVVSLNTVSRVCEVLDSFESADLVKIMHHITGLLSK
jgi:hypothetical protein